MKIKILVTAIISTILLSFTTTGASAAVFNDVNASTNYYDGIMWAYDEGIIQGYGNGSFGPDNCVRRAELVKMILEYVVDGSIGTSGSYPYFSDVNSNDWFYKYVREAVNRNIIEGYSDGTFRPNNCVNRAEAMKIAVTAMFSNENLDNSSSAIFYDNKYISDMEVGSWYAPYARFMFKNRLMGTAHTQIDSEYFNPNLYAIKFFPGEDMSRKEVAEMLYRISKNPLFQDVDNSSQSTIGTPILKTPANNTNYSNSQNKTVNFTWSAVAEADHYTLMIRLPQSNSYFVNQKETSNSGSYYFNIKSSTQGYYWKVRVYDDNGNYKDSNEYYFNFSAPSLTAGKITLTLPADDSILDNSTTGVNFQFLPTTNVSSYQLGLKMPGDNDYGWYDIINTGLNSNGYIGYFINKGTSGFLNDTGNYYWKVRAWNPDKTSYTDSSVWTLSYPGNVNSGYITSKSPSTGAAFDYGTSIPFSWENHYMPTGGLYGVQLSCANYSYPSSDHWLEWDTNNTTYYNLDTANSFTPENTSGFSFNTNIYCHWRVVYYTESGDPTSLRYISDVRNLIIVTD